MRTVAAIVVLALFLGGCLSTVATVVTAPVKIAAKGVDLATTSQSEADRNRGRKIRKAEEWARKTCGREIDGDDEREQCFRARMSDQGF